MIEDLPVRLSELSTVPSLESKQLVHRFADVAALHVLSFQPMTVRSLTDNLRKMFDLSITFTAAHEILSNLESENLYQHLGGRHR